MTLESEPAALAAVASATLELRQRLPEAEVVAVGLKEVPKPEARS